MALACPICHNELEARNLSMNHDPGFAKWCSKGHYTEFHYDSGAKSYYTIGFCGTNLDGVPIQYRKLWDAVAKARAAYIRYFHIDWKKNGF